MRVLLPFMVGVLGFLILVGMQAFRSLWKMEAIISTITDKPEDVISRVVDVIESADTGSPAPSVKDEPVVVPEAPKVLKNTIIPHTIQGCPPCEYDKRVMYPAYKKAGWKMADPQDETTNPPLGARYPWYEIFDANGKRTVHVGSLSTYKKK